MLLRIIVPIWVALVVGTVPPASGQEECRKCVREKLEGAAAKAAAAAAIGAMGGAAVGLPGATCGAILGAVAASVDKLVEVAQCESVCKAEAQQKKDPQQQKCDELFSRIE